MIAQDLSLGNSSSQSRLDNLREYVVNAARNGTAAHQVERERFRKLLTIGHDLFGEFIERSQLSGTPAVLSDIPVFHEICGDSAIYFTPSEPRSLIKAGQQALDHREKFVQLGFENAKQYTCNAATEKVVQVYESLAQR